jgi:membrane protein implicated in regulation of membrane protease activity
MVVGKQEVAMAFGNVFRFTATVILSLILGGCGLSGVRGTVLSADENRYLIRDYNGTSWTVHRDDGSHRDRVQEGDEVRVFMGKDGYAAYIQKLEQ